MHHRRVSKVCCLLHPCNAALLHGDKRPWVPGRSGWRSILGSRVRDDRYLRLAFIVKDLDVAVIHASNVLVIDNIVELEWRLGRDQGRRDIALRRLDLLPLFGRLDFYSFWRGSTRDIDHHLRAGPRSESRGRLPLLRSLLVVVESVRGSHVHFGAIFDAQSGGPG